jgi:hypothetical protein
MIDYRALRTVMSAPPSRPVITSHKNKAAPSQPKCDDELGMFFHLFRKSYPDHDDAFAFRGHKSETRDWLGGSFVWFTIRSFNWCASLNGQI